MINLEQIKTQVSQRVDNSTEVIMGVMKNLIDLHNDFCGCDYCKVLKGYVTLKKLKRRYVMGVFNISIPRPRDIFFDIEFYIEQEIAHLKKSKNLIKKKYINLLK